MKLKPVKKSVTKFKKLPIKVEKEEPVQKTPRKKKDNKLPPDEYRPMFPPQRIIVRDTPSHKDPTKSVKQYLELSVKRFDDDEAKPHVWIQMYQESDFYTGYLKGKTVYLPLDVLYDLIDGLTDLSEECDKRNIEQDTGQYTQVYCSFLTFCVIHGIMKFCHKFIKMC